MSRNPPGIMDRPRVEGKTPMATLECWFGSCFPMSKASLAWGFPKHDSRSCYAKSCPLRGSSRKDLTSAYSTPVHSPMRGEVIMQLPQLPCSLMSPQDMIIYQCPTAQQNHKDNKALKPAVFHYLVAGFPQFPPNDPGDLSLVPSTAWRAATQACKR